MKRRPSITERALTAQRMTPGAGGGRTALPARVAPRALLPTAPASIETTSWSSDGDIVASDVSDPYEVLIGGNRITAVINLTAALTGDTDTDVLLDGASVGTVTVASGTTRGDVVLSEVTAPGDIITLETTAVGTGSARASAQIKIET